MVEANYKITAIRDDGIVDGQPADVTPIAECAALPERCTSRRTLIGCFAAIVVLPLLNFTTE
jgi:hypothetical protein